MCLQAEEMIYKHIMKCKDAAAAPQAHLQGQVMQPNMPILAAPQAFGEAFLLQQQVPQPQLLMAPAPVLPNLGANAVLAAAAPMNLAAGFPK